MINAGHHSCECCLTLGYLDDILRMEIEGPARVPTRMRLLHPINWYVMKRRAEWAADLLDESGK